MKKNSADPREYRSLTVGVIGLGYVGLPLVLSFCEVGNKVIGIDIHEGRVETLNGGKSYITNISSKKIKKIKEQGFIATCDFSAIKQVDVIIICVPTPLDSHYNPDLSYIENTVKSATKYLKKGHTVILESTTFPGTTRDIVLPLVEQSGLKVGSEIYLVYSPERESPGDASFEMRDVPKIVSGITQKCLERGVAVYGNVINQVVPVSSTECAEFTKLLENSHRAVNIGLVNELKLLATKLGLNIFEIVNAAATKPFGFSAFYPGPGVGGHCIPIDPMYLAWKAKQFDVKTEFIELAAEVNKYMIKHVIDEITLALNDVTRSVRGSKILVLGIAYKKNVDDARESPSINLMETLNNMGAIISYSDPMIPTFPDMRTASFKLNSVKLSPKSIGSFDCVVLLTDHDSFDYKLLEKYSSRIIDTRGRFNSELEKVSLA